jgi:uncharacterized repeat protein (TIGR03803 family)
MKGKRIEISRLFSHHRFKSEIAISFVTLFCFAGVVEAQMYSVLHDFGGAPGDGSYPYDSLLQSGSLLYGLTFGGGTGAGINGFGLGTIFDYNLATNTESVLYSFQGGSSDGANPTGSLIQSGSTLYGLTDDTGGIDVASTIFQYDLGTDAESVLYSFPGGIRASGELAQSGSNLYGQGIYQYSLQTGVLHYLPGSQSAGVTYGSLILSGSILYGMTETGGSKNDGTIFEYNLATDKESTLYSFGTSLNGGEFPAGSLILSGSTLYGMTTGGGYEGTGTIFEYNLNTSIETVLHSFSGYPDDGSYPYGSLILSGPTLYGMTELGGANRGNGSGYGTIFEYDLTTNTESLLHSFDQSDGAFPQGSLIQSGLSLYGMTEQGGTNGEGVIFSLTVPEPTSTAMLAVASVGLLVRRRRNVTLLLSRSASPRRSNPPAS